MALDTKSLAHIGTGGGNNFYLYRTADVAASVAGAGYFNNASNILNVGDWIMACTGVGGTIVPKIYSVTANAAGVVTVAMPAGLT